MDKDFWRNLFRPENKKTSSNIVLALFVGVLLLILGKSFFPEETPLPLETGKEVHSTQLPLQEGGDLEQRMETLLSEIEGAGQVRVMLTYRTTAERVVAGEEIAEETRTEENGKTSESLRKESSVVMTEDGKGATAPLVLTEKTPQVEGVVIVAQGGSNAVVCNALNSAAQALLNVPAHKIAVLKMK